MGWAGIRTGPAGALPALGLVATVWLAGCVMSAPSPSGPAPGPASAPASGAAVGEPAAPSVHGSSATPPEHALAGGRALPLPPAIPLPVTPPAEGVAILYSGSSPMQSAIAARVAERVGARVAAGDDGGGGENAVSVSGRAHQPLYNIDIDRDGFEADLDAAEAAGTGVIAAVGPAAFDLARQRFNASGIVFSQVLTPGFDAAQNARIRGVAPVPPPALQFAAWAEVDPDLGRIGMITGADFAGSAPAAALAAAAIGAELVHRESSSDLETLYIFRRLAPEIDGLWLVPDSAILSTSVIESILALARELEIGVLVFSEALLDRGGLLSVEATADDVAAAVVAAIERMRAGEAHVLPPEIPLSEGAVRVNPRVAVALGLPAPASVEWVIRAAE